MFQTIPVALSIPISSNGDWMAFNAASLALVFPDKKKKKMTPNNINELNEKVEVALFHDAHEKRIIFFIFISI